MPEETPKTPPPIVVLYDALLDARENIMPSFTPDSFVQLLQLDGDKPDGQLLATDLLANSQ